jgi:glycosyl transferase family 87
MALLERFAIPLSIVVLAGGALVNMRHGAARFTWIDFQSFYNAGQHVHAGGDPYGDALAFVHSYSPHGNGTLFATHAYVYTPFFAVLMIPFTFVSGYAALTIWDILNVVFVVGAVYACMRIAGRRPGIRTTLLLAAAAAVMAPVQKEWSIGQTDVFALFMVCTSFWARLEGRPVVAGLLLGVICPVKPALGLLIVFVLWKREFVYSAVAAACSVVFLVVPSLLLGPQVRSDQWTVWRFWSNEFLPFAHNDSPAGVFARLFTTNPVVRPLVTSPHVATVLWLAVVGLVLFIAASLISHRPLQRDTRTLLELGLVVEAILLVTPLSEWPYLVLMVIPLVGIYCWVRSADQDSPRTLAVAAWGAAIWVLLLGPAGFLEYRLDDHFVGTSRMADVFVILAPIYLYVLIAAFALQALLVAASSGSSVTRSVRGTLQAGRALGAGWFRGGTSPTRRDEALPPA